MEGRFLTLIAFLIPLCTTQDQVNNVLMEPYDFLFDTAVEAYYKGDWVSVILNMERALRNKATIQKVKTHCRINCANQTRFDEPIPGLGVPIPGADSVEDLGFFQKILKRADCVNSCESEKIGPSTVHKISEAVELEFRKRSPYNYLQVAYFKINKLNKAVAAANTFYLANPDHMEMRQNLEYYRMMAGVQEDDFKDLEARPHMAAFLQGKRKYSAESFAAAIDHFEEAVEEYFVADKECRVLCEGAYDYDGYNYMEYRSDLFQAISDHYIQVLNCKQRCSVELASTAGREKPFEDFLPSHFDYLQFSYYNTEKWAEAIACAKTFLLFHPEDEVMNQNLAYYSAMLGEEQAATITARPAVKQHISQLLLEKELLYFGYEVFGITFVDPDAWTPVEVMPLKLREKQKLEKETAARITEEIGNLMKEIETLVEEKNKDSSDLTATITREGGPVLHDDIKVTMTSKQLNGTQRVLLDGVITDDECRELQRLSNSAALKGDGYRGRPNPHSPSEMFQGITVLKALKLGQEGVVPLKSAQLFFDMSEKVRAVLDSYFRLDSPLYFSYSHLVCRSAIEDKQEDRNDLSHAIHADNCLLVSELNECLKEPPAYTHRDYSAILYLNDDFEGGDFIFTELDAKTVTATVRPQCGRVVGFGAGKENPHGVKAITQGQRCALALWFTLDPIHEEKERIEAAELLKMLSAPLDVEFRPPTETVDGMGDKPAAQSENTEPPVPPPEQAQNTAQEHVEKPGEVKPEDPAEKPAEPEKKSAEPESKAKTKVTSKTKAKPAEGSKAKAPAKTVSKAGDKAKAKVADKAKVAKPKAKTDSKQAVKTTAKQPAKKEQKPVTKKTVKKDLGQTVAKTDPKSTSDSQKDKEEL